MEETMCERTDRIAEALNKARASLQRGDFTGAWIQLVEDLRKHPSTREHPAISVAIQKGYSGGLSTAQQVREFIDAIA